MEISARVSNREGEHEVTVETEGVAQRLELAPKHEGRGSSVNGGEMLFLALATCYCNDVYREAARAGLRIDRVEVTARGQFGGRGEPARAVSYEVRVESPEAPERIATLLETTDQVAEVQNTLRQGVAVRLSAVEVRASTADPSTV